MQPLFTENFLSHHLIDFKLSNVPNIRLARNIIDGLIMELKSGKLESLKEEEFKSRFLNEFFGNVLGFNYGNSNFWTLSEEVKTKVDGTKVDGALGYFGKDKGSSDVRAVIEIKDANKNLDEKQNRKDSKSAVSQAFEYASKMGEKCKWIIVSNFKEIRFYSNFQGKYQTFFLEDLSDESKLKELLFLFHKDRFIKKDCISSTEQLYKISNLELKENEKPRHIVDEIYSSLLRFKGLQFIDPNYLASIKPFNILNEHVWHYSDGKLLTINPKIHSLFKHLDFEDGEIKISDELKKELKEEKVIEYEDKIDSFIRILNRSQINEISCVEDYSRVILRKSYVLGFSHKHFFRFSDKDGFTKSIDILKNKSCDCISCNFKNFDFKHLLSKLKIAQNKDECITLEYAYGNYLVSSNNYKNAYNIYKNLSEKIKGKEGLFFGWEMGAGLGFEILAEKNNLFSGFVLASPTHATDKRMNAVKHLKQDAIKSNKFLLVSAAPEEHWITQDTVFLSIIDKKTNSNNPWRYTVYDREDHYTTPLKTMHEGLSDYFSDYKPIRLRSLKAYDDYGGLEALRAYYKKRGERYDLPLTIHKETRHFLIYNALTEDNYERFNFYIKEEFSDFIETISRDIWYNRYGKFYLKHKNIKEALYLFNYGITKMPDSSLLYKGLGDVYLESGNMKKAKKAYNESLKLNPDQPELIEKLKDI